MKVLMLSKACYIASYRRKLEEMAAIPDMELSLMVPPYWRFGQRKAPLEPGNERGYEMIVKNPILNGNFHLHFYPGLAQELKRLNPDLIHIDEEPYDFVTFHSTLVARRLGIKTLFFTWQNIQRRFPPPFSFFERYTLGHSSGAIAGNAEGALILREKGFRYPLYVIPQFGVDTDLFRPAAETLTISPFPEEGPTTSEGRDSPLRIGFVGRLVEEKGVLILLKAASGLKGSWTLSYVGDGPLYGEIGKQASALGGLGVSSQVTMVGSVPSMSIPERLRSLDVLVLPSMTRPHWKEQFGRVLIEAMACGVPVVGSNSGEIPNVIGEAGIVVKEGDQEDLREKLQHLMDDRAYGKNLAYLGRLRVAEQYTQPRIATKTCEAYRQILSKPTPIL